MPDVIIDPREHMARGGLDWQERVEYGVLLREASGKTAGDWIFSEEPGRRQIHQNGLMRLIWAAGLSLAQYHALRECSKDRSDVLLRGAEKLGIATVWHGWPDTAI